MKRKVPISHPVVAGLLASLCCLLWGSVVPFLNVGYREFGIDASDTATLILFAGCRFFLAGCLTVAFACLSQRRFVRPQKGNWPLAFKLCLVQTVLQYVAFYIGVAHTQSVKSSIIQGLNAFVNILVACYLFRTETMNRLKWLGGFLGVAGIVLMNLNGEGLGSSVSLAGEGMLFVSLFTNACCSCLIKRYGQKENSVTLSGWQFIFGGAIMMAAGLLAGGCLSPRSPLAFALLLYLAMVSAVAYTLWAVLLSANPVSRIAVYNCLQPIFGVLLALVLVGVEKDAPLARYAVSLALVCLSILVVGRGQREKA